MAERARIDVARHGTTTLAAARIEKTLKRDIQVSLSIIDVNHAGRWIRGIELLGGDEFDLEKAVKPFNPRRPLSGESRGVTYDKAANAAFVYFRMKSPIAHLPETALKYSHSITLEAELAFDSEGGLIWLRFSLGDENRSSADFVSLIDAAIEPLV